MAMSSPATTATPGYAAQGDARPVSWRRPLASLVVLLGGIAMVYLATTRGHLLEVELSAGVCLTVAGLIDQKRVVRPRPRFLGAGIALLYVGISAETLFRNGTPPAFLGTGADYGVLFILWGLIAGALDLAATRGRAILPSRRGS